MANSSIRVGVVGVNPHRGWASVAHIPALQALPDYEIRAASTTGHLVDDVRNAYGLDLVFDDSAEMITHPEVDLVVLTVKVPFHRELVTAALHAGKVVYSEWPLGVNLDEATIMADHARRAGVRTVIGLQNRVTPVISYVRDMVAQGHLGEVLSTTMNVSALGGTQIDRANAYLTDIRNGANMLTIALGQSVDALNYSLGEWRDLAAVLATRIPELTVIETGERIAKTAYDQAAVIGTLASGATASVHCRGLAAHDDSFHWEINGSEGYLMVTAPGGSPGMFPLTIHYRAKGDSELRELSIDLPQTGDILLDSSANNVALMYSRLAKDLREDTWTVPSFEDAVNRHRMLAAIDTAANTGTRQSYEARTAERGVPLILDRSS
jgi:predicted dehydrogenase